MIYPNFLIPNVHYSFWKYQHPLTQIYLFLYHHIPVYLLLNYIYFLLSYSYIKNLKVWLNYMFFFYLIPSIYFILFYININRIITKKNPLNKEDYSYS